MILTINGINLLATVVKDRYSGTYSGGKFIAYNCGQDWVDEYSGHDSDDVGCCSYWDDVQDSDYVYKGIVVGIGETEVLALKDLENKIMEKFYIES